MSIKFASVQNFTFPPTPKSLFLEIMHNIRGSCAAVHDDRFTNFIYIFVILDMTAFWKIMIYIVL